MKTIPKAVLCLLGIVAGLAASLVMTSCNPEENVENANTPPSESTGIPEEVADEVDAITKRLEAEMLSEAGMRVNAKGANADAAQGTGIPKEVANEVDAISKRLQADMLSEAGMRVNARPKSADAFSSQSTGIPEEVADEVDAISKRLVAEAFSEAGIRVNRANENATSPATQSASEEVLEVEVKRSAFRQTTGGKREAGDGGKPRSLMVELEFVTFNHDKSLFVGYYQEGWFEMVSLHDAKTKKQLGSVYCDGGVPTVFRFSKDKRFLGAKASVGWYVWKIPSFEKVFVLGDIDIDRLTEEAEQGCAEQPATAPESKPEGEKKPKPESEGRSQ